MKNEENKDNGKVHQNIDCIVEETKKMIMDEEPEENRGSKDSGVSDQEVKKAIEFLNPDASSMESRG
ncbi:MAG: hypothetical protein LBQ60_21695 [Bacteroidales bacterium]|jgi:hypothetical protein|nr:hypothetical protein [Bacteroidales bacterium]